MYSSCRSNYCNVVFTHLTTNYAPTGTNYQQGVNLKVHLWFSTTTTDTQSAIQLVMYELSTQSPQAAGLYAKSTWLIIWKQRLPWIWMITHNAECSAHVIREVWRLLFWRRWPMLQVKNMQSSEYGIHAITFIATDYSFSVLILLAVWGTWH